MEVPRENDEHLVAMVARIGAVLTHVTRFLQCVISFLKLTIGITFEIKQFIGIECSLHTVTSSPIFCHLCVKFYKLRKEGKIPETGNNSCAKKIFYSIE